MKAWCNQGRSHVSQKSQANPPPPPKEKKSWALALRLCCVVDVSSTSRSKRKVFLLKSRLQSHFLAVNGCCTFF